MTSDQQSSALQSEYLDRPPHRRPGLIVYLGDVPDDDAHDAVGCLDSDIRQYTILRRISPYRFNRRSVQLIAQADMFLLLEYPASWQAYLLKIAPQGPLFVGYPFSPLSSVLIHQTTTLLVAPGDVAALARTLHHLITHPEIKQKLRQNFLLRLR